MMRPETLLVLVMAMGIGGLVGLSPLPGPHAVGNTEQVQGCTVVDGDTLRCGHERVRLLGIDAPELPGHCRPGRACAPGDPFASTASLKDAAAGPLTIMRVGVDRYGRTLAVMAGDRGDLSCWQLDHGRAIYKASWDDGGRIASICPHSTR